MIINEKEFISHFIVPNNKQAVEHMDDKTLTSLFSKAFREAVDRQGGFQPLFTPIHVIPVIGELDHPTS